MGDVSAMAFVALRGIKLKTNILIFCILFTSLSMAQSNQSAAKNNLNSKKQITHFYRSNLGGIVWNEQMMATKAGVEDPMIMQLNGMVGGLSYHTPWVRPRLSRFYQLDFAFGSVKGQGNRVTNFDEVSSQTWATLTVAPGLLYKLNQVGEIGISAPVVLRYLDWKLEGSDLEIDKSNQFSYGIAFLYNHYLNTRHSIQLSMNYQEKWTSSLLSLKWQYTLKNF